MTKGTKYTLAAAAAGLAIWWVLRQRKIARNRAVAAAVKPFTIVAPSWAI